MLSIASVTVFPLFVAKIGSCRNAGSPDSTKSEDFVSAPSSAKRTSLERSVVSGEDGLIAADEGIAWANAETLSHIETHSHPSLILS